MRCELAFKCIQDGVRVLAQLEWQTSELIRHNILLSHNKLNLILTIHIHHCNKRVLVKLQEAVSVGNELGAGLPQVVRLVEAGVLVPSAKFLVAILLLEADHVDLLGAVSTAPSELGNVSLEEGP